MILLTGATGTVGSSTVKALKARGATFKVAARSIEKAKATGVDAVHFDWDDFDSYLPAMKGATTLFLLPPVSDRQLGYTFQLVAAAKRAGVKHIVKLSVIGADAEPGISLGRNHLAAEREIKVSGMTWTMLRPTFFMENFTNFYGVTPGADAQVYLPWGTQKAAFIDGRDVGEVAATVLSGTGHEGKTYDLTGPAALSAAEALAVLSTAFGHKYTYVDVPMEAAVKAMADMKMPLWQVDGMAELNGIIAKGWSTTVADGVKQVLGRPARDLATYAKDFKAR